MEQKMVFRDVASLDSYNADRKTLYADPAIRQNGFMEAVTGKDLEEEGAFLNSFVMEGITRRDISIAIVVMEDKEGAVKQYALAEELPIEPAFASRFVLFNAEVCSPEEAELTIVVENGKYLYREYVRFALGHIV